MTDKTALVQTSYVVCEKIESNDHFLNNSELPLLIYKGALLLQPEEREETIEALFKKNGYGNSWRGDVYDYDHFHTNTHEVLAVFSGHADIVFGGEHGKCQEVNRGDVIIIPAGVAHRKSSSSDNFSCIGVYPDSNSFNMNEAGEVGDKEAIQRCPVPDLDPVYGNENGHLHTYWETGSVSKN